jgi:outer membrane protein assembly factor BamB
MLMKLSLARWPWILTACLGHILFCESVKAVGDWPQFRGPNGQGVSTDTKSIPETWSASRNLAWKTPLPGPGASSPIIVGDAVFVTCYSGYGLDRNEPGDIKNLKRHLVCLDLTSGAVRWQREVPARLPEDPYDRSGVSSHGYASHTPVSDGKRVYCFFGKGGVYAFDLDGNECWHDEVGSGSDPPVWGSSSSPVVFENLLIVTAAAESQSIVAFDTSTGRQVWKYQSGELDGMWGTPSLQYLSMDRTDLVMLVAGKLWSFNPKDGAVRWQVPATDSRQAYTNVVVNQEMLYASTGQNGGSLAIAVDTTVESQATRRVWQNNVLATYSSPVFYRGRIYVTARGVLSVMDAKTGKLLMKRRLEESKTVGNHRWGSLDYASPIIGDGKLYWINASGQTFVFNIRDEPEQVAVNELGSNGEVFWGTPAISDGRIVIRSSEFLYCVAERAGSPKTRGASKNVQK